VVLLWRLLVGGENAVRDAVCAAFVVTWIPFLASFLIVLIQQEQGPAKVLTAVLVTAASDTGGYMVGVFIGRHPMAPLVSPKKSWEGFGGSIVVSLIFAIACVVFLLDGPWWVGVVLGVLATLSATVGDLGESLVKRDLQIKDMSQILPGHGGLLDRVDSLLVTVPMVWLVLAALLATS
jgi:phosphatidate cytidylyltransferase